MLVYHYDPKAAVASKHTSENPNRLRRRKDKVVHRSLIETLKIGVSEAANLRDERSSPDPHAVKVVFHFH